MRQSFLFLLFVIPQFILASNAKIDVYISSRDCFKCISQTKEISKRINQKEYDLNIFVEYKSKKNQVLVSMGDVISEANLIVNRDEVLKRTEDGNSVIEISCGNLEYSSLLNDFDINDLNKLCSNENSYSRKSVPDSLFEHGNFKIFIEDDRYYFLHNDYDVLKYVDISDTGSPKGIDFDISISADDYNDFANRFAKETGKKVLHHRSAVVNANNNFLPIQSNKSIFLYGEKIVLLQTLNFFIHDKKGEYMFKGKNFISIAEITDDNTLKFTRNQVSIDTSSSYNTAITMSVPHVNLGGSNFVAPIRLYNNADSDNLMSENAIAVSYTINEDNTISFGDREFIGKMDADMSTQMKLRKFLYGSSHFSSIDQDLILTYGPLEKVVDIQKAKLYSIDDFLTSTYDTQAMPDNVNTIGIDLSKNKFTQGYVLNKEFFIRNFGTYTFEKILKCDFPSHEKGNIYYFSGSLYKIHKDESSSAFYLSKCSCE